MLTLRCWMTLHSLRSAIASVFPSTTERVQATYGEGDQETCFVQLVALSLGVTGRTESEETAHGAVGVTNQTDFLIPQAATQAVHLAPNLVPKSSTDVYGTAQGRLEELPIPDKPKQAWQLAPAAASKSAAKLDDTARAAVDVINQAELISRSAILNSRPAPSLVMKTRTAYRARANGIDDAINKTKTSIPEATVHAVQDLLRSAVTALEAKVATVKVYEQAATNSIPGTIQLSSSKSSSFGIAADATMQAATAFWKDVGQAMRNIYRLAIKSVGEDMKVDSIFSPARKSMKDLKASLTDCQSHAAGLVRRQPYQSVSVLTKPANDALAVAGPSVGTPPIAPEDFDAVSQVRTCLETTLLERTIAAADTCTASIENLTQLIETRVPTAISGLQVVSATTLFAAIRVKWADAFLQAQDSFANIMNALNDSAYELYAGAANHFRNFGVSFIVVSLLSVSI